ncbi:hypothetical protein JXA47_00225 [Candidatus Sumerlaeota bacterium]|nr:hypothetical protein [Candidatus Sumerlaeota bacterium]
MSSFSDLSAAQRRRVEGISTNVDEYLTLRFGHAERVNPKLGQLVDDLKAQLLVTLREVLVKGRAWGSDKHMVADVLCGEDLQKRYDLFNTTGQYSILHEIVSALDERKEGASADAIRVTNMRDLYQAIDSQIGDLIELAQTWIWWDLPDAVTLQAYQGQTNIIRRLLDMELTEQVKDHYRNMLELKPTDEVTREMMLAHHLANLERLVTEFGLRRRDDLAHQEVLKRDIVESHGVDLLIMELATELQALERLEKTDPFDDKIMAHYARRLAADPAHLTRDHILMWQREHVADLKTKLLSALHSGQILGRPYNFKERQLEQMQADLAELKKKLPAGAIQSARATRKAQEAEGEVGYRVD